MTHEAVKRTYDEFRMLVAYYKKNLRLDNDEIKPLTGTDLAGRGTHQYMRVAIVSTKKPPHRSFILFVESDWLKNKIHELSRNPDWMASKIWDNKWNFIEEITHKPGVGETLNQFTKKIGDNEDSLWIAIYEFLVEQGVLSRTTQKFLSKSYGIPRE